MQRVWLQCSCDSIFFLCSPSNILPFSQERWIDFTNHISMMKLLWNSLFAVPSPSSFFPAKGVTVCWKKKAWIFPERQHEQNQHLLLTRNTPSIWLDTLTEQGRGGGGCTHTHLTLGYGYCFPFGYRPPVNLGITMFGTRVSFMVRNASLSPSGDHQWATWEWRSSSAKPDLLRVHKNNYHIVSSSFSWHWFVLSVPTWNAFVVISVISRYPGLNVWITKHIKRPNFNHFPQMNTFIDVNKSFKRETWL